MPTADPRSYTSAGADAAGDYGQYFRDLIAGDQDIQRIIQGVWGNTPVDQRPSDTPKHLESANDRASKQIAQVLASKGVSLPDRSFVNPRSGALEGHRGWSGLNGLQKAGIIGAGAAGGLGLGALAGLFGTGAGAMAGGAGAALPNIGVASGLPAAAAAGGAGAGGALGGLTGFMASPWAKLIAGGGSLIGGLIGGKKTQQAADARTAGATLPDILPMLLPLIQQLQQQNQQGYAAQQRNYLRTDPGAAGAIGGTPSAGAVPLKDALARMAFGMLPGSAKNF